MSAVAVEAASAVSDEPTRARYSDESGYAERDGVKLFWEVYGEGDPTHLFLCPWPITHSRLWKGQVPYLSRHARVLTFDCRGNGRSDRPRGIDAYRTEEMAADALAVMDATDTERAIITSISGGARPLLWLLANHPDRFAGAVFIGPWLPLTRWQPTETMRRTFREPRAGRRALRMGFDSLAAVPHLARSRGYRRSYSRFARRMKLSDALRKFNREYVARDQRGFLEWNYGTLDFPEPHSTRQVEDGVEWGMQTDAQTLVDSLVAIDIADGAVLRERDEILAYCSLIRCPVLVIQGEYDLTTPPEWGQALAEATGGRYVEVPRTGHLPNARRPVVVNLALRDFAESLGR